MRLVTSHVDISFMVCNNTTTTELRRSEFQFYLCWPKQKQIRVTKHLQNTMELFGAAVSSNFFQHEQDILVPFRHFENVTYARSSQTFWKPCQKRLRHSS
eukprot:Selendium_serpulae@DN5087_c0_g2_i2.p1